MAKPHVINLFTSQTETTEKHESEIKEYKICPMSDIPTKDFSELSGSQLEEIIVNLVKFEGPIHTEELIQRIKMNFGIGRVGSNIKSKIYSSIESARESKKILIKNDFLWPDTEPDNILRKRCGNSSVKIEWICNEEIIQAIYFVLNDQYSTPKEDLIVQTSRVLGIKALRNNSNSKDIIESVIGSLIRDNYLTKLPNDTIYFQKSIIAE